MTDQKMTALVTGGTGFVGQHVLESLTLHGHRGCPASPSVGFDISRREDVLSSFVISKPDVVIHLADVYPRGQNSATVLSKRTLMGLHLLEAAAQSQSRVLLVTRAKKPSYAPEYTESDVFIHRAAEHYRQQYGLQVRVLGLPEIYGLTRSRPAPGPGYLNMIITAIVHAKLGQGGLPEFSNHPKDSQPYLHVHDAAKMIVRAAMEEDLQSAIYWAGGPERLELGELAAEAAKAVQLEAEPTFNPPAAVKPTEVSWEKHVELPDSTGAIAPKKGVADVARNYLAVLSSTKETAPAKA